MTENLCTRCNSPNRSNARFCAVCGAPLPGDITAASKESPPPQPVEPGADTGVILQGRYRVIKELGRGGFGAVYRAWDANLNKYCAIKENLDASPEAHRQFIREATVLANLSHPNLPRVTDHFFIPDKGQYLVMDFVEGEDLTSRVSRQGTIPVEQAVTWISQVADALEYLHSRQPPVIHRDIKPSNIRITPEGQVMLVDFGLVKVYDPNMKTTMGARAVTPGYAPPEQYGQGKTDARSDIYALGATLYNLLTARDPLESVQRMAGGKMPPAEKFNPLIPPQLGQVIECALALEPGQRYQSATDFQKALRFGSVPPTAPSMPSDVGYPRRIEPTMMVKPVSDAVIRPAAHVAGTQAVSSIQDVAFPVQESRARPNRLYMGIALLVILLLCIGTVGGLASWAYNQQKEDEQATQDAQDLAAEQEKAAFTSTAKAQGSATAQAIATSTARAAKKLGATSTAQAQAAATAQALDNFAATIVASRSLVFGPTSGSLAHNVSDKKVILAKSSVNLTNFIAEVRFLNPYPTSLGTWDAGFLFRHESESANQQFRLIIRSNAEWIFWDIKGDPDANAIAKGTLSNLDVNEGGSNWIRLICTGNRGLFYVNGIFVAELDLSSRTNSGDVLVATGVMQSDGINGKSTIYQDFTVWAIP